MRCMEPSCPHNYGGCVVAMVKDTIYEHYRLLRWYVPAYCYHAQSTSLELNWSFQHFLE